MEGVFSKESCSLPKQICSFPSVMTKMPLRDLRHASVNLKKNKCELTRGSWPVVKTEEHMFFHFGLVFNIQLTGF